MVQGDVHGVVLRDCRCTAEHLVHQTAGRAPPQVRLRPPRVGGHAQGRRSRVARPTLVVGDGVHVLREHDIHRVPPRDGGRTPSVTLRAVASYIRCFAGGALLLRPPAPRTGRGSGLPGSPPIRWRGRGLPRSCDAQSPRSVLVLMWLYMFWTSVRNACVYSCLGCCLGGLHIAEQGEHVVAADQRAQGVGLGGSPSAGDPTRRK